MSHPYRNPVPDANDLSLGRKSMSGIASVLAGSENLTTGIQDNVRPLLDHSGLSRYEANKALVEELGESFVRMINNETWSVEKFNDFINAASQFMFMKEMRKAVLAACVKYHDRISSDMYDWLVNDPNIVDEAPISIKRELFARDRSLFRLYVTPLFEEYLKDQSLYFLSREMRGTNINDVLDFRMNNKGLQDIINMIGENNILFDEMQSLIRIWFVENGWSRICSFRFDFFMGMQKADRIQMCKRDHSFNFIWYVNAGIRKGFDSNRINELINMYNKAKKSASPDIIELAMVFQDPLVVSVFSARIVDILRKYVDKSLERLPLRLVNSNMLMIMKEKEMSSTLKWCTSMLHFGSNAFRMIISKNYNLPDLDEKEFYEGFYKHILYMMVDDRQREAKESSKARKEKTTQDVLDMQEIPPTPSWISFGETETQLLKKSDPARKIFCQYIVERTDKGDPVAVHRCLPFIYASLPRNENEFMHLEMYESLYQSIITIIIKSHRVRVLCSERWRSVITDLINITPWRLSIQELVVKLFIEFYSDEVANKLTTLGCVERMKLVREWAERMCITGVNMKTGDVKALRHKYLLMIFRSTQVVSGIYSIRPEVCPVLWEIAFQGNKDVNLNAKDARALLEMYL
ncbi:15920_t:CDS:10 [Funneliformis caledonium]|uniref:15920_t:CDS:1 n=1 Tax=Funneliformis caledonium TaxID=1117310 RepID=A0A9N8ZF17_9GLOM|nr:15920_t:CDS:10 [Funneliformis caledonium]